MKNKIILVLALGLIVSPLFVKAETTTTTTNVTVTPTQGVKIDPLKDKAKIEEMKAKLMKETEILRNNLITKKAEIAKNIADMKSGAKKKLEVKSQENVTKILESIFNKMNTQVGQLSQVDIKISNKIAELEKAGINVTDAKAQYTIAKASLENTMAEVMAMRTAAIDQTSVETSKDILRNLVKQSEDSMKATGKEYMKIVPLISQVKNDKVETTNSTSKN
jgi:hypothetical protein